MIQFLDYNCQTFIDELCKALNITLKFSGALGSYINALRQYGSCDLTYKNIDFKTHKELDEFVCKELKKNPKFITTDDWTLLKSFDRAFWLRYFKDKNNQTAPCNCPFGNPTESQSLYQNMFTY